MIKTLIVYDSDMLSGLSLSTLSCIYILQINNNNMLYSIGFYPYLMGIANI